MIRTICDFCEIRIDDGVMLRYKRSIFEFLRIIPKLIYCSFWTDANRPKGKTYQFHLCDACKRIVKERLFAEPNIVEELQNICQNNMRRPVVHEYHTAVYDPGLRAYDARPTVAEAPAGRNIDMELELINR
jgi:hypothetical protein